MLLRELALKAMDAARTAGAAFADIRLSAARTVDVAVEYEAGGAPTMQPPAVRFSVGYGVRAMVAGAWGFATGYALTSDAITGAARAAVTAARDNRPRHRQVLELASAPSVTNGQWATPVERDPLTVPLSEQGELALAALAEASTVKAVISGAIAFQWRCPTVVFATTDGTVLLQRLTFANPSARVRARVGPDMLSIADVLVDLAVGGYGYEAVRASTLALELRRAGERAVALAHAAGAARPVEIGRYDVVLSAPLVANLLATTAAEAVDLERALGYRANRDGTSFAAPPMAILGQYRVASELLTLRADRSQLHGAATVGWDDEGVRPIEYTCIQDGIIVDYHTNRQTAAELADWYLGRGQAVRSHGCARRTGSWLPIVRVPNLTLAPAAGPTGVEDLIAGTKRGFFVEGPADGRPDQQVLNAQYAVVHTGVREIRHGRLGSYVKDFAFQFTTPQFWKSVDGLGGADSAQSTAVMTDTAAALDSTQPFPLSTVRAVPVRVRQVNVLNTGRAE